MTKRLWLEPAGSVLTILGGTGVVSKILGVDRSQVWRWTQPKAEKGTGGLVPSEHQEPLLDWAEANNKPLTADMIIRSPGSRWWARSKAESARV